MSSTYRIDKIYDLLLVRGKVSVQELAEMFHVTPTTIRRDLIVMEEKGLAQRVRGYAIAAEDTKRAADLNIFEDEKRRIAQAALTFVKNGMSLALDTGNTVRSVARAIMESQEINTLDVVTNSLITAQLMGEQYPVTMPGGIVLASSSALVGVDVERFFSSINIDLVFLGSTGVRDCSGLTVSYPLHLSVKRNMVACATKRIAVLDSSKFAGRGIFTFCDWEELDALITVKTDSNQDMLEEIEAKGVEIVLA